MSEIARPRRATTVHEAGAGAQSRESTSTQALTSGATGTHTGYLNESACQTAAGQQASAFSHAILLANFDPSTQEALELTLRRCRYKVVRPEVEGISLDDLKDEDLAQVDFIVFNLTQRNAETWRRFERVCGLRKADGRSLMIQGWSRIYHGPGFHDAVEKLGARMEYA